jgi:hypothetical protein
MKLPKTEETPFRKMQEVYFADVIVDGKVVKSAPFGILTADHMKLIRLVKKGAADTGGIGRIYHEDTLVYECNAAGERTGGTWDEEIV